MDEKVLHEIIRKLTPAIGRVLAKRRKLYSCNANPVQGHGCDQCRIDREYNSHLEQVLDPDIVEAVVMRRLIFFGDYTEIEVNDTNYGVALDPPVNADAGGFFKIVWTIGDQDHEYTAKATNLPALVAEAWQV